MILILYIASGRRDPYFSLFWRKKNQGRDRLDLVFSLFFNFFKEVKSCLQISFRSLILSCSCLNLNLILKSLGQLDRDFCPPTAGFCFQIFPSFRQHQQYVPPAAERCPGTFFGKNLACFCR